MYTRVISRNKNGNIEILNYKNRNLDLEFIDLFVLIILTAL